AVPRAALRRRVHPAREGYGGLGSGALRPDRVAGAPRGPRRARGHVPGHPARVQGHRRPRGGGRPAGLGRHLGAPRGGCGGRGGRGGREGGWPRVRIIGEIAFDDVPRFLAAADVVAVPQRATTDTVGQVPAKLVDAMAMARPVVATSVSMIPEMLDGCGVVVPPGDPPALAKAIAELLADPLRAETLGSPPRARRSFRSSRD